MEDLIFDKIARFQPAPQECQAVTNMLHPVTGVIASGGALYDHGEDARSIAKSEVVPDLLAKLDRGLSSGFFPPLSGPFFPPW